MMKILIFEDARVKQTNKKYNERYKFIGGLFQIIINLLMIFDTINNKINEWMILIIIKN